MAVHQTVAIASLQKSVLVDHEVIVKERLESTSKDIILIKEDDDQQYSDAEDVCKDICGRIYFPSTLDENLDVEQVLDDGVSGPYFSDDVWIRMFYNETVGDLTDPDNNELVTFRYLDHGDSSFSWRKNVRMNAIGRWAPRSGTHPLDEYVLCELTRKN